MIPWTEWWVWASAGLILAILELVAPGYIFLGFAVGAGALAVLLALGVGMGMPMLLVLFSVLSLIAYLLMRRFLPGSKGDVKIWERDIND